METGSRPGVGAPCHSALLEDSTLTHCNTLSVVTVTEWFLHYINSLNDNCIRLHPLLSFRCQVHNVTQGEKIEMMHHGSSAFKPDRHSDPTVVISNLCLSNCPIVQHGAAEIWVHLTRECFSAAQWYHVCSFAPWGLAFLFALDSNGHQLLYSILRTR